MDIMSTINASRSDINSDFLYCASMGHHNNSRRALGVVCHMVLGLQPWF